MLSETNQFMLTGSRENLKGREDFCNPAIESRHSY